MKSPLQKRSTSLPVIPTPLCSLLLTPLLPESCQGMMQTRFQRVIRPPSLVIARMVPATETSASIFSPHPPWRTIQFLKTEHIHNVWNSSSILRGGWKALDTLGRKPLDPIFWSDNIKAGQSSLNARLSQYRIVSKFVSSSLRIYDQQTLMTISPFTHIQRVCITANFQIGFQYKDLKWNSKGEHDVIFHLIVSIFLFSRYLVWNVFFCLFGDTETKRLIELYVQQYA